ncbi:MAG TPA: tetratricopeptide repeat protein [Nitrospiria bacterium]|nr:tetratricopeptide repeat protein [Nitrospiria bacterium]
MRRTAAALILMASLLALPFANPVSGGQFEDAVAAYERGDYATAYRLFQSLAEQGDAAAQYNLGLLYDKGKGAPQDYSEAVKWYQKAAEQGQAEAQYNLGFLYAIGQGVPQDYVLAHMWFNLAASRFSASEGDEREMAVKNRDTASSKMTPAQIAEAQRLAREWKPKKEEK